MTEEGNFIHGYSRRDDRFPLYNVWRSIKNRCCNIHYKSYKNYGGRGIKICDEWINNPKKFIEWGILNGYKLGLQIDRINNDGNYEPLNCRFVTSKINCQNRRSTKLTQELVNNIRYYYKNFHVLQSELAILYNVSLGTINDIILNKTWR